MGYTHCAAVCGRRGELFEVKWRATCTVQVNMLYHSCVKFIKTSYLPPRGENLQFILARHSCTTTVWNRQEWNWSADLGDRKFRLSCASWRAISILRDWNTRLQNCFPSKTENHDNDRKWQKKRKNNDGIMIGKWVFSHFFAILTSS